MQQFKKLSTWLILIGLLVMSIPFAGKLYTHYQQEQLRHAFLVQQEHAKQQTLLMEEAFVEDGTTGAITTPPPVHANAKNAGTVPGVIGQIAIAPIEADLLLLEGSSSRELRYGAGHLTGTAMPGETGNCAIAGHRNYTFGTYFNRLGEVKTGDSIVITYGDQPFTYQVYESFTVLPSDVSVLEQPADKAILTLITCTPKGHNSHRLIVRATLQQEPIQ